MREKKLFLTLITIIIGLAAAVSARAGVCPTASPQGVGCASEPSQLYYCASACRSMDIAYCPENSLTPVSPCSGLDSCGVCSTCETNYLLCTASAYPTRSCTYNDPALHCATLTNSNCNAGQCAICVTGYTLCATDHTCIATQSCELWETFNACTNACEGAAPTLKLNYNSVNASNYIIQSSSPVLSIPPSGLVGIGTTEPGYLFDVNGLGNFDDFVRGVTPLDTDDYALATVEYVNSFSGGGLWGGEAAGNIWNLNSGNIGIGTTAPEGILHLTEAPGAASSVMYNDVYTTFASGSPVYMYRKSNSNTLGVKTATNNGNRLGLFGWQGVDSGSNFDYGAAITVYQDGTAGTRVPARLELYTFSDSASNSPQLVLAPNGNVGIGTTAPGAKLDIRGVNANFWNISGTANGNYANAVFGEGVSAGQYAEFIRYSNASPVGVFPGDFIVANLNKKIIFSTAYSGGYRGDLVVNSTGNVGIGTTAPGYLLDVNGLGNFENWAYGLTPLDTDDYALTTVEYVNAVVDASSGGFWDGELTSNIWSLNSGNVGIGTTDPGQKLDLVGSINLENTTSATTGIIYKNSTIFLHNFQHPTGGGAVPTGRNTFLGVEAGNLTMGSTATNANHASFNTGIGYGSMLANTIGQRNSALGYYSLYQNTSGNYNSAFGYTSLYSNSTGSHNAAFGYSSLTSTTGSYNSGFGSQALTANISGTYNSAFGYNALASNSTGAYNSAFGASALNNTTGGYNSAVGYSAMNANNAGQRNSVLGYAALSGNTTGNYNIALGHAAGSYIANGSTGNTTSDYSVYLGSNTKALIDNGQNEIVIGYDATGIGSNSVVLGNDSIVRTALKGSVGIGTTEPGSLLDVNGLGNFEDFVTGVTPNDTSDYHLTTVEYVNAVVGLAGGGLWSGELAGNIWSLNSGNVGIGTTNPVGKLDVNGSLIFSGSTPTIRSDTADGSDNKRLGLSGGGGITINQGAYLLAHGNEYATDAGALWLVSGDVSGSYIDLRPKGNTGIRVNESGLVGIGTTAPNVNLDIAPAASDASLRIHARTSTTPVASLELVRGPSVTTFGSGAYGQYRFRNDSATLFVDYGINDAISQRLTINSSGNVGIGTTDPGSLLDVNGLGNFEDFVTGITPDDTSDYHLTTVEYVNDAIAASGGGMASFSASTGTTYNGSQGGYTSANALCNTADPGSHVCTSEEMLYTINSGSGSSIPANTTFWISNGPPAYTANANDCQGWTSSASGDYGTVWIKLASGDGFGALNKCNLTYKFACCK
ncbi:MAG: hypothetical protein WC545_03800 [Patescibacteria group bacterium]